MRRIAVVRFGGGSLNGTAVLPSNVTTRVEIKPLQKDYSPMSDSFFERQRARMVDGLRTRGIKSEAVLRAFGSVPREAFVPSPFTRRFAYRSIPLPIGRGQTLSQPYIVARMLDLAEIKPEHTVLDVGSGSGYQTALLAKLCRQVYAIEIIPELVSGANAVLRKLGINNAECHVTDGNAGLPAHAPYDAILVAATASDVPSPLVEQLADGGRLILPIGRQMSKTAMTFHMLGRKPSPQRLQRITRERTGDIRREDLEDVYFVPFVGTS